MEEKIKIAAKKSTYTVKKAKGFYRSIKATKIYQNLQLNTVLAHSFDNSNPTTYNNWANKSNHISY
jgi:hypothetical protein